MQCLRGPGNATNNGVSPERGVFPRNWHFGGLKSLGNHGIRDTHVGLGG